MAGNLFLKIRRGGECFWVRVVRAYDDGSKWVRCDNQTTDPEAPRMNVEFLIGPDEPLFDRAIQSMRDQLKIVREQE